jgi:prepilin-type N-terminal cleavage/methylation domain-containing protein
MSTKKRISGFTLVEILIVVVIMAVLAAAVIPQFTSSTEDAKKSTAEFNISSIRSVIQTYRAHHDGSNPGTATGTTFVTSLTKKSNKDGSIPADGSGVFGPYLVEVPDNPFTNDATVTVVSAAPSAGTVTGKGYAYNPTTAEIWLDSDTGDIDEFSW